MPTHTITLLARGRLEEAQATVWRPIAERWPDAERLPTLQMMDLEDALGSPAAISGSAALVVFEPGDRTPALLADLLFERSIPAVFLMPPGGGGRAGLDSESVIEARADDDPAMLAATLRALAQRQGAVDAMVAELGINRRFHTGLRGQMDRVNEELQLAAQVQRDFLPKSLPAFHGLEFGVLYRPCGYVSGDIYDVVRLDERHAGFFIADAIGHGVPAALMTMVVCRSLPMKEISGSTYRLVPPAEALSRLNIELIRRQGETPRFVSAVYGLIDTRDRTVTLAGAGHPAPLRISPRGVEKVETDGGLLGVFADDPYHQTTFRLEEDESLLLYSDGFETAFPEPGADAYGRRLPTTHYVRHFAALGEEARSGMELSQAMISLGKRLDAQSGSLHQLDDLTALALCCRAPRAADLERAPAAAAR